jgi:uncharacterized 2Fe-2S/4Fe-4S cluster protein (DUF4445 family)
MAKVAVKFIPDEKEVRVEEGTTILEAANMASVYVNSICGGEGICGKCKVIVHSGDVSTKPTSFLTREEIQQSYVLACTATIKGNVEIEVPLESRLEGKLVLKEEDAIRFGGISHLVGKKARYNYAPISRKLFMQLPKPTLSDSISDHERLYRELRRNEEIPVMQTGLSQMKTLSSMLRENNWQITVTLGSRSGTTEVVQIEPGDTSSNNYGVAVDIGTTTIVAHLVNLNTTETMASQATYNSQIKFGEDVITRMMFASAPEKLETLQNTITTDINNLISGLVEKSGIPLHDITCINCAGNTTMTHFLYGLDTSNIRREPYVPLAAFVPVVRAAEIGIKINPRGLLSCLPMVSSYVGGDITAGALFSGIAHSEKLSIFIDVGTNGEIVFGNKEWLVCCSASAGPAFEGGGISSGMRAATGAIERVKIQNDHIDCQVIGGGKPLGLCGSGLIDICAELLKAGCINKSGRFILDHPSGRVRQSEEDREFVIVYGPETELGRDITITEADLATFIRSKGAIYTAAEVLVKKMGFTFTDVENIYISGGFGNYLDIKSAVMTGLLPDLPENVFKFIGNASVQGAKMTMLSQEAMATTEELTANMTSFELSVEPEFMNGFSASLFLPHTDIEKFPTVEKALKESKKDI